jgi:hypothetical protein
MKEELNREKYLSRIFLCDFYLSVIAGMALNKTFWVANSCDAYSTPISGLSTAANQ